MQVFESASPIRFQGPFFTLQYPDTWEMEIIEDIPAFFDPLGGGALQVVASQNDGAPFEPESEMEKYLSRLGIDFDLDRLVRYDHAAGKSVACEFVREGRFWLVNMIASANRLLVMIYNADELPDPDTVRIIMKIIQTVRIDSQ